MGGLKTIMRAHGHGNKTWQRPAGQRGPERRDTWWRSRGSGGQRPSRGNPPPCSGDRATERGREGMQRSPLEGAQQQSPPYTAERAESPEAGEEEMQRPASDPEGLSYVGQDAGPPPGAVDPAVNAPPAPVAAQNRAPAPEPEAATGSA